ncbi:MAG TPA: ABC transporter permease, partial [Acidimicrobiia bacterium]|nr:ABC transporter permease [Acidimicrobiia bacterium]
MRTLAKLSWVELKLFIREPLTVVFSLALPLIVLFVLGGVFGNEPSGPGEQVEYRGVGPMSYYVPAYLALVVASVAVISIPTHLAGSRERGVLKRFHASSVSAWSIAGAEVAVATVLSTVSALILMIAARLAYDFATPESVGLAAFVFLVLVVGFAAFGIFLGAVLPTARAAQAVGMLVWFVMLFLGGAGPPPEVLTGAMQRVADLTPLWHGVQMMQQAWLGLDAGASWLVFGVIAAGSAALGLRFFRWEWDAADSRLGGVV